MEIFDYVVEARHKNHKCSLYTVADMHIGNPGFDFNHFSDYVKNIKKDPNSLWVGLGDYADWISLGDKRFKVSNLDKNDEIMLLEDFYNKTMERVAEKLSPIMDRCIGLAYGNHEMSVVDNHQYDPVKRLCERFKVHNLGWCSFTRLCFRRSSVSNCKAARMYKIYCSHGNISSRKKGAKINRMEDETANFDADIYLKAHGHDSIGAIKTILKVPSSGAKRLIAHNKIYMMAPSFLKTYNIGSRNYGEVHEYPPSSIAEAKIELEPFRHIPKMRLIQEVSSGKYSK